MKSARAMAMSLPITSIAVFAFLASWSASGVGASVSRTVMASTTKIQPCVGHATTKPKVYVITCADANTEIRSMTWKTWSSNIALGTGTYEYNTCTPTCVAGHNVNDPATVTLSKPKVGSSGSVFSQMTVKYQAPKTKTATVHFTLPLKAF